MSSFLHYNYLYLCSWLCLGAQTTALQEQSALVKRFVDVKKMLESGEINPG